MPTCPSKFTQIVIPSGMKTKHTAPYPPSRDNFVQGGAYCACHMDEAALQVKEPHALYQEFYRSLHTTIVSKRPDWDKFPERTTRWLWTRDAWRKDASDSTAIISEVTLQSIWYKIWRLSASRFTHTRPATASQSAALQRLFPSTGTIRSCVPPEVAQSRSWSSDNIRK